MDICKLGKFGPCNLVKCGAVEYLLFVDVPALLMLCQTIGMSVIVPALACAAVACAAVAFTLCYSLSCLLFMSIPLVACYGYVFMVLTHLATFDAAGCKLNHGGHQKLVVVYHCL